MRKTKAMNQRITFFFVGQEIAELFLRRFAHCLPKRSESETAYHTQDTIHPTTSGDGRFWRHWALKLHFRGRFPGGQAALFNRRAGIATFWGFRAAWRFLRHFLRCGRWDGLRLQMACQCVQITENSGIFSVTKLFSSNQFFIVTYCEVSRVLSIGTEVVFCSRFTLNFVGVFRDCSGPWITADSTAGDWTRKTQISFDSLIIA